MLQFEKNVKIGCFPSPYYLNTCAYMEARYAESRIQIGEGTWISNGFVAIAEHTMISIGRRALIGTNVEILDTDGHGLDLAHRHHSLPENAKPVYIEDDVFIGSNAKIMKGVRVGTGSIVANGSIVVGDVPPNTIVGGNPAKVIRYLEAASEKSPEQSGNQPL